MELAEIAPAVWRDLLLESDATLATLHAAIQAAFPWTDSHLHSFRSGRAQWTDTSTDPDAGRAEESQFTISDVLPHVGSKLEYVYDFGDRWLHGIEVKAIRSGALSAGRSKIECLGGARACPPEDCGGYPGYENLLRALSAPNHAQHEEVSAWLADRRAELVRYDVRYGGPFNPEGFDLDAANRAVSRLAGKRRRRT